MISEIFLEKVIILKEKKYPQKITTVTEKKEANEWGK